MAVITEIEDLRQQARRRVANTIIGYVESRYRSRSRPCCFQGTMYANKRVLDAPGPNPGAAAWMDGGIRGVHAAGRPHIVPPAGA